MDVPFLGAAPLHLAIRKSGDAGVPIASTDSAEAESFVDMAEALCEIIMQ